MTENHFVASQKGPVIFNFIILRTLSQLRTIRHTDRVCLRYGICTYRKILTDTDRKIPIRQGTLHKSQVAVECQPPRWTIWSENLFALAPVRAYAYVQLGVIVFPRTCCIGIFALNTSLQERSKEFTIAARFCDLNRLKRYEPLGDALSYRPPRGSTVNRKIFPPHRSLSLLTTFSSSLSTTADTQRPPQHRPSVQRKNLPPPSTPQGDFIWPMPPTGV